jgi:lysophospholipase L1-like esterase
MNTIVERLKHPDVNQGLMARFVAVGSSNTARGHKIGNVQNWVDWFDTGLARYWGRQHTTINVGRSGETSRQVLARFEGDVMIHRPHLVIVTVGGNDANPKNGVTREELARNLTAMIARCRREPDCLPVLQTYYSIDEEEFVRHGEGDYVERFHLYMQTVRDVASRTGTPLIDHLARWERLRQADPALHKSLLHDRLHLNGLGNMVFALDVMRCFQTTPVDDLKEVCAPALRIQAYLDRLEELAEHISDDWFDQWQVGSPCKRSSGDRHDGFRGLELGLCAGHRHGSWLC